MDKTEQVLLRLHLTPGLGHTALFKLHAFFNDFSLAAKASAREWRTAGVAEKLHACIPDENAAGYREICRLIDARQIRLISFWDQRYPPLLREIHDPPALLYLRGDLPRQECFAIVGSRRATTTGLLATRELAKNLALHDICIVSGLARGIDSAAHFGALDASGKTVAVLGCGIDQVYPRENTPLAERIKDNGALISEYPPGTPPLAGHFPGRNRIISGLSHGVLIVEAAEKSGSLITGDFALEQGRELFAMPGAVTSSTSRGTNRLLKEGAQLVTEATDILEQLWPGRPDLRAVQKQESFADTLSGLALDVYRQVESTPLHCDEIARKCGLTPMELSAILLDLELQGGIQALPGQRYIRSRL